MAKVRASYCLFSFKNNDVRSATKRKETEKPKMAAGMRYFCSGKKEKRDGEVSAAEVERHQLSQHLVLDM